MSVKSAVQPRLGLRGRIYSLDGLRGVAAISVVFHHAVIVAYPPLRAIYAGNQPIEPVGTFLWWFTHTPLHVPWLGAESVYTFFILSGLVLTRPVIASTAFAWLPYYAKRIVRLYLPVWGSLAVFVALTLLVAATNITSARAWTDAQTANFTPAKIFRDAIVLFGLTPINGVLWSLRWEILFSLLLPLYVMFAVTKRAPWYAKVLAIFVLALFGRTLFIDHRLLTNCFSSCPCSVSALSWRPSSVEWNPWPLGSAYPFTPRQYGGLLWVLPLSYSAHTG
jgi:peptidoglycan/LPS O-acetylase OafA/YrhL